MSAVSSRRPARRFSSVFTASAPSVWRHQDTEREESRRVRRLHHAGELHLAISAAQPWTVNINRTRALAAWRERAQIGRTVDRVVESRHAVRDRHVRRNAQLKRRNSRDVNLPRRRVRRLDDVRPRLRLEKGLLHGLSTFTNFTDNPRSLHFVSSLSLSSFETSARTASGPPGCFNASRRLALSICIFSQLFYSLTIIL